ncbi:MAG TPA: CRTAC1 family protein [Bryobacteraceae bacterium]|nr:CRTAC1 family protein [Bryobacteraceae bacterium]
MSALAGVSITFQFVDRTSESGITATLHNGSPAKKWIMEANGGGVAVFDYDRDGRMDVVVVNGTPVETLERIVKGATPPVREDGVFLYRNLGDKGFADVTRSAGLTNLFWGTGANAADYDGDGFPDILLTNMGQDVLFRNQGDGTFKDVSRQAGLASKIAWHTGSAFGDYDGDGDLDLYIAGYVSLKDLGIGRPAPVCQYLELPVFCGPLKLAGEPDVFYRNNGDGTFSDFTAAAGLVEQEPRFGFTVVFEDLNRDRKPDIFVANDSGPNYLYLNEGRGRFTESALVSGVAYNSDGRSQANMGVAIGDIDNDQDLDLLTTTFSEDHFPLFTQSSAGIYEEVSAQAGLVRSTTPLLGWACGFVDFDNDGWRDLWLANGHVYPTIGMGGRTTYEQPVVIVPNQRGHFGSTPQLVRTRAKASWRGGATGDFNNDGKMDLIVTPVEGSPALIENRSVSSHHWIGLDLRGKAVGAEVYIAGCGKTWFDTVRSGGSYISADDPRRHFGLGSCSSVDSVTIKWLSGRTQVLKNMATDRYHVVEYVVP